MYAVESIICSHGHSECSIAKLTATFTCIRHIDDTWLNDVYGATVKAFYQFIIKLGEPTILGVDSIDTCILARLLALG